jgi:hypothetical protein
MLSGAVVATAARERSMSQSAEAPISPNTLERGNDRPHGAQAAPLPSAILFTELVLAHYRWFVLNGRYGELGGLPVELAPPGWQRDDRPSKEERAAAEARYLEKLAEFTGSEGDIVAAYWSVQIPSGIVMTTKKTGRIRTFMRGPEISLHRATTWLTGADSPVAELLHHCDTLGNKAAHILTRTPKEVAMTWISSTESYLLGVVEGRSCARTNAGHATNGHRNGDPAALRKHARERAEETVVDAAAADDSAAPADQATVAEPQEWSEDDLDLIRRGRAEIVEIEKYYDRAAGNAARFLYFWGMLSGAVIAGALAVVIALIAAASFDVVQLHSTSTRFFFACYTAGALGAIVSVLTRMRGGRFILDYEVGRMPAFWLGAFRPFIGAVFGLVVYFALQSELLQLERPDEKKAFFFFTLFAFLAGFSERLTHVILGRAERTVAGTLEEADKALGDEVTTEHFDADGTKRQVTHKRSRSAL